MEGDVWIISHSKRTKSAWRKKISGFLSLHKNPKNPICLRKRRCLDFSLTPQEPKEPNLHAIINLVVTICVQRESGRERIKKGK
jgi:hypothetical protein